MLLEFMGTCNWWVLILWVSVCELHHC